MDSPDYRIRDENGLFTVITYRFISEFVAWVTPGDPSLAIRRIYPSHVSDADRTLSFWMGNVLSSAPDCGLVVLLLITRALLT